MTDNPMIDIYGYLFLLASGIFVFNFGRSAISAYEWSKLTKDLLANRVLVGLSLFSGAVVIDKLFWALVVSLPLIMGHRIEAPWMRALLVVVWLLENLAWSWVWHRFWRTLRGEDGEPLVPAPIVEEPPPPLTETREEG